MKIHNTRSRVIASLIATLTMGLAGCSDSAQESAEVAFSCSNGEQLQVTFRNDQSAVLMRDGQSLTLQQESVGSGFLYANEVLSIRGKGRELTLTAEGAAALVCEAQR